MPETPPLAPEIERKVQQSFAAQGLMQSFAAVIEELDTGHCQITAPITEAVSQQQGFAHAGLTFALGDSAAGYAALSVMAPEAEVLTVEMKINLLAPAAGDRLVAVGRVVKPGRRLVVVAADVFAEAGDERRHVATLQGTMIPITIE